VKGEEEAAENYSASQGLVGVGYLEQTCSLQDEILALVGAGSCQTCSFRVEDLALVGSGPHHTCSKEEVLVLVGAWSHQTCSSRDVLVLMGAGSHQMHLSQAKVPLAVHSHTLPHSPETVVF